MKRMGVNRIPRREFEEAGSINQFNSILKHFILHNFIHILIHNQERTHSFSMKRRIGRPRVKWCAVIKEDVEERGLTWDQVNSDRQWEDRSVWRELVQVKEAE